MVIAYRLVIKGKVQGVYFRESMRQAAESFSVVGWVCNHSDGSVRAFVQGSPDSIKKILGWVAKGPPRANVLEVLEEIADPENFTDFQRRTDL